jgi:hypothetical protein
MIAVSMSHKAYAFDWSAFVRDELHDILLDALSSGNERGLVRCIEANRDYINDRYQGGRLSDDWKDRLGNYDVHEFADLALTRFYDPMEDYGIDHYGSTSTSSVCPRRIRQRCWARRSGRAGRTLTRAVKVHIFRVLKR